VSWVEGHNKVRLLLEYSLVVLFLFAQTQASTHAYLEDHDDSLSPECAFCVVASHLDDAAPVDAQSIIDISPRVMPGPIILAQPAQTYIGNAKARAPPFS